MFTNLAIKRAKIPFTANVLGRVYPIICRLFITNVKIRKFKF